MTDRDLLELIAEKIVKMDERMNRMETDIKLTKESIARIENTHGEKLSALFDGYQQNTEQLRRIEEKVSIHEEFIIKRIK